MSSLRASTWSCKFRSRSRNKDVGHHPRTSFATHSNHSTLQCKPASTKSVKETATTASEHCQRERETESAEQKSAEDRRVQLRETTCRQRKERNCSKRTSLRAQHLLGLLGSTWTTCPRDAGFQDFELPTSATHADGSVPPQHLPVRQVEVLILPGEIPNQGHETKPSVKCSNATNHGSDSWDR